METKLSAEHPWVTNSYEWLEGIKNKLFPDAERNIKKENIEGQIGGEITNRENWLGPVIKDAATDVLTQVAVVSAFKKPSPKVLRTYPPELPGTTTKGAITSIPQTRIDKFKPGSSPSAILFNSPSLRSLYNKIINPNYNPIVGSDELTETFKSQWLTKAKTGEKTYYYDIEGHRMLKVPGMQNLDQQTRYKSWLTQQLINRINTQSRYPEEPMNRFLGQSFYDTMGMEWRLVRTEVDEFGYKSGSGPLQRFEPMPLNEIDSRKLKAKNTSDEEKVILRELLKKEVKQRNAIEKQNPWLIEWNADTSGQNYHEHMIGLDESEFWNSGAGKAEGYMNNDVYNLEKGLGNIVVLRDPRFKLMKDIIADYITPRGKTEIYPGLKKRTADVKKFTDGPYKGMNAVIGYDANPKSKDFSNLTIRAYNPNPNINESKIVDTIPNWYANVYAKDLNTGKHIIPENIANDFVQSYVDAVLAGDKPGKVALEDLGEELFKKYGISKEIPAPGGLQQNPEYQSLGTYTLNKKPFDKKADEATFKTTPKNQRLIDKWWKKNYNYWQKGEYTQLDFYNKLK